MATKYVNQFVGRKRMTMKVKKNLLFLFGWYVIETQNLDSFVLIFFGLKPGVIKESEPSLLKKPSKDIKCPDGKQPHNIK